MVLRFEDGEGGVGSGRSDSLLTISGTVDLKLVESSNGFSVSSTGEW